MKTLILIHCWGAYSIDNNNWHPPWYDELIQKARELEYNIIAPIMPNTDEPTIKEWVSKVNLMLKGVNLKETIIVGHSIGTQTILRALLEEKRIAKAIYLVAPWFNLVNLEGPEAEKIAQPWITTPIDYTLLKKQNITAIFSDNDPWVPLTDAELFKQRLNAKVIIENNKGHFDEEEHIEFIEEVL